MCAFAKDIGIDLGTASVLVYTIAFVFHELRVSRQAFFMPAAAQRARAPAMRLPSKVTLLLKGCFIHY